MPTTHKPQGALHGLRILDMATVLAAPVGATLCADHGAEVVKLELPDGSDALRGRQPVKDGVPLWWKVANRGKQGITLDVQHRRGARSCCPCCRDSTCWWRLPHRHYGPVGPGHRDAAACQSAPDHHPPHGLRTDGPLQGAPRLRADLRGHERLHQSHGRGGRPAPAQQLSDRGLHRGSVGRSEEDPSVFIAVLVPRDAAGFTISPEVGKLGWYGVPISSLEFLDVEVPHGHLLGTEGEGFDLAQDAPLRARIGHAAMALGRAIGAVEIAATYMSDRKLFGKALGEHQGPQWMLADMVTKIEATRALVALAAEKYDAKDAIERGTQDRDRPRFHAPRAKR